MTATKEPQPPALPDYVTDPNAVLKDEASWRYGMPPDYSKTREFMRSSKKMDHPAGSLPEIVENLVKNWEIEASFKKDLKDWRTVDPSKYTFAINGAPPQTAEHMLNVGTYNAIIAPNDFYDPGSSDFGSSHKTFKRMMPTFAWEVLEVYSGPPVVSFKWRHWGVMKNDYVGFNDKGEKVRVKAHGGPIDIQGVTIAHVNDKIQVEKLETWFDPMDMFRQVAREGNVTKLPRVANTGDLSAELDDEAAPATQAEAAPVTQADPVAQIDEGVRAAQIDEAVPAAADAAPTTHDEAAPATQGAAAGGACPFGFSSAGP